MKRDKTGPGNYLSMDGGSDWISALPVLITLEEIMKRLQRDLGLSEAPLPCKVFDVIIASGHAALVALLVGKMYLTPSQAREAYKKLGSALSVGPTEDKEEHERNMEVFKKAFTEVLEEHGFSGNSLLLSKEQDERDAKMVVCTQNAFNTPSLYLIRSYPVRGARSAPCTILQAACASVASPDRFPAVNIGTGHKRMTLVSPLSSHANPTKVLLPEARRVFGDRGNVAAIVSIGTGRRMEPDELESTHEGLDVGTRDDIISKCEYVHQDVQKLLQKLFIYFRFNHNQTPEDMADRSSISARLSAYFQEEETNKRLDDAVESMRARQKGGNLLDINVVDKNEVTLKPRPSVTPNFVGREDVLDAMRQRHFEERSSKTRMPVITVLSGLGGSGKTQIALKFADKFEEKCPDVPVYFLNASSEDTLKGGFETIIRSQGSIYRSQSCEDALAWLAAKVRKWYLILDNADDPSLNLFTYIPKSAHGNVVITTRNATHALLSPDDHHAVEGLPMNDAVSLVLKMSRYEVTAKNQILTEAIVKELGSLPLALAHAGAYIFVHQCLPTYIDMYRASQAEFLNSNQALPHDYQLTVATTVQMSLNKLPQPAKDMMVVFSHLEVSSIPLQIISTPAERHFRTIEDHSEGEALDPQSIQQADILMTIFCPDGEWFESDFNILIQKCLEYSLLQITTREDDRFFSMHVLVQTYLQSNSVNVQDQLPERLVARLLGSAITINHGYRYHALNRLLAPHLRVVAVDNVMEAGDHAGFGQVLKEQGNLLLSVQHWEWCLALRMSTLEDESLGIARTMGNLAGSYSGLGKYQEALELEIAALKILKHILGDSHSETSAAMVNLASSYHDLGRYQDALDLEAEVLETRKCILGDDHTDTAAAMGNLARSYYSLGRYQEAAKLEVEVLEIQTRILGEDHPNTFQAMANLATSYRALGRYQDALELELKVLELRKRILGDDHPRTFNAMTNLSRTYSDLGRHEKTLELDLEVVHMQTRISGEDHPETIIAMGNLAMTYLDLGRYQEALGLEVEVLEKRKRILGDDHPSTVHAMGNLASVYRLIGRYREALDLGTEVLEMQKRVLGNDHPNTVIAMGNLARAYSDLGKYQEAENIEVKVLDMRKHTLQEDHPDIALAMGNLAATYRDLEKNEEALELELEVLEMRKRTLKDDHPLILLAMSNLASSYHHHGRYQDALELTVKVLEKRRRILGDDHPDTVLSMSNLASTYSDLGRYHDAISLEIEVLKTRKRILGSDHPKTLQSMANLGSSYNDLGKHEEALELYEQVLEMRSSLLGQEHPSTLLTARNLSITLCKAGFYERSIALLQTILPLYENVRGVDDPQTDEIRDLQVRNLERSQRSYGSPVSSPRTKPTGALVQADTKE